MTRRHGSDDGAQYFPDEGQLWAPAKVEPPSVVTEVLSDNKHSAPSKNPSPAGVLRASRFRPGQLSMGLYADSDTWTGVLEALTAAGFKAGDVCRLTVVRR